MWQEVLASVVGTGLIGVSYVGLYKLGWHSSRKEQEHKIKLKLQEVEEYEKSVNEDLGEYKEKLLLHLDKLNSHKIEWKKGK